MPQLYGQELTRRELLDRVGDIDQVAGVRRVRLQDGPEDGVVALEVRTGGGLSYSVLASRTLDVSAAELDGVPLGWRTGAGDIHPAYVSRTNGWNHGWFGGLLATCGLDNVGNAGQDELGSFAQHGHINGLAARNVGYGARWEGDRYLIWIEGELRQKDAWMPGTYDVVLRRRVESELGGRTIRIRDEVENMSRAAAPLLLLYHVNFGWPLLAPESVVVSRSRSVRPAAGGEHDASAFAVAPPLAEHRSQVFAHELIADSEGMGEAAILNERLGVGVALRFPLAELPYMAQWKALVAGRYVLALEPTNQRGGNRLRQREAGTMPTIAAGAVKTFHLEMTALRGGEVAAARARMAV